MTPPNNLMDFSDYPKRVELRDGTEVWLRPMRPDDRDRLYAFFSKLPLRDRRVLKHDVSQREVITNWCQNLDYDQVLPILGIVRVNEHEQNEHERVVADGTLHQERHGWAIHVARIRLVITPEMRKKGLGHILLRELYDRAVMRGIQKIQVEVREDSIEAQALLKQLGYKKEAVFRKHAVDLKGKLHNVIIYYNDLSELWQKMEDLNIDSDFFVVP